MRRIYAPLIAIVLTLALGSAQAAAAEGVSANDALVNDIAKSIQFGPLSAASVATDESDEPIFADECVQTTSLFAPDPAATGGEQWQLLPRGLIYRPYLAGVKESRMAGVWNYDNGNGRIWDITLGGQAPLVRYGVPGNGRPEGIQISIEGAGQVRLDRDENCDVEATDYRFGVPITWGNAVHQNKLAIYHLSSHLGDEFLLKHPGFPRLNYSENVLVYGHSVNPADDWRVYGEVGYGFDVEIAEPWEFQFGVEWAPSTWTGFRGAPFFAVNSYLREEVAFGGNFVAQTGWAWRRDPASGMFRVGLQYYNGKNEQFSLFNDSEQKFGFGIWYDF